MESYTTANSVTGRGSATYRAIKRTLDIAIGIFALVLASPLMAGAAAMIRCTMGKPVLFSQVRPGLHSRPFKLFKFRTMSNARGPDGALLTDAARLTRVGSFLRRTSLDELPQLLNVVKGDMSLVGPRPLLPEYLPYYTDREKRRHDVRPGITGLAQVSGRNNLSWEERLELDAQYVEGLSLLADFRILVRTALKVVTRSDVQVIAGIKYGRLDHARAGGPDVDGIEAAPRA